jgi:hypothetical protein
MKRVRPGHVARAELVPHDEPLMKERSVRPARRLRPVVAALLLPVMAGCYNVRPLTAPVPEPGARVVATLTDEGSREMAGQVGPRVRAVEGVFQRAVADTLEVDVVRVLQMDGVSSYWNLERVRIPRQAVATVDERLLDTRRSVLAGGAIVAGALLVARTLGPVFTGGGGGGEPVPPH